MSPFPRQGGRCWDGGVEQHSRYPSLLGCWATRTPLMRRALSAKYTKSSRQKRSGEEASSPKHVFAKPRVGYRMAKGDTQEQVEPRASEPSPTAPAVTTRAALGRAVRSSAGDMTYIGKSGHRPVRFLRSAAVWRSTYGLREDSIIVCWGRNDDDQSSRPLR